ncbi:rapamycin-insensitive companion of mTOR-like isoform X2 [Tubulanus polymorphus]|uniref:rapamycin-insensitive companion of mTOR-like isoform X2 n=1 Tax=Tubulanus polymorphus TaxID=672921 RepID=UPI003DA4267F
MAASFRGRCGGYGRSRRISVEDYVPIDLDKDPKENLREILQNAIKSKALISSNRKLGYLNNISRLCSSVDNKAVDWGISDEEILICLRVCLVSSSKEIRAATLRAIGHLLENDEILAAVLKLRLDYLIARSLDIYVDDNDSDLERIQAVKLIRKIIQIEPRVVPQSLIFPLVAIAFGGTSKKDPLYRLCYETICELAVYNPSLAAECGVIRAILHQVLQSHMLPRINESLVMTLLYLLNHPRSRRFIKTDVDLEYMLAPFTDSHVSSKSSTPLSEENDKRYTASKLALVTMFRSWPGMVRLCRPDGNGLQSLIGTLFLPNMQTRTWILDLLYDIFYIPLPVKTDDFNVALLSICSTRMKRSWALNDGFVAQEGTDLLPHKAKCRMNLVENHLALLLLSFITARLLESLVEVITTSEPQVAVRATILLGELLKLANKCLPHDCRQHTQTLPSLINLATATDIAANIRNRASTAVNCLNTMHSLSKRGPVPCSMYMEQILSQTRDNVDGKQDDTYTVEEKHAQYLRKPDNVDMVEKVIRDSLVLTCVDSSEWNWELMAYLLKWPSDGLRSLVDQTHIRFVRRIVFFYRPSNRLFACLHLEHEDAARFTEYGCLLIDFLLQCSEAESDIIISEWLADISHYLREIRHEKAPQNALFSPSNVSTRACRDYFLFIGRFSNSIRGEKLLEQSGTVQLLVDLVTVTTHDIYIKLIISSLNYTRQGLSRLILTQALTATSENARLYAAKFMRVLLRADVPFISSWGMELLVTQLYDESSVVALEALSVIEEACEDEVNLHMVVKLRPSLLHLREEGSLMLIRFVSIPSGFKYLSDAKYVQNELDRWRKGFNARYVGIVEERLQEALTSYEKGTYYILYYSENAKSPAGKVKKDVFVPLHFYGQLVQHKAGYRLLQNQPYLSEYFETIRYQYAYADDEVLALKTALWAVGHLGSSQWGILMLQDENIVSDIIKLAEESSIFTVRGTAFYALGLIASTHQGANLLRQFGWECLHHSRSETWPVHDNSSSDSDSEAPPIPSSDSDGCSGGGLTPVSLEVMPDFTDETSRPKSFSQNSNSSSDDDERLRAPSTSSGGRRTQHLSSLSSIEEIVPATKSTTTTTTPTATSPDGNKVNNSSYEDSGESVFSSSPRKANSFAGAIQIIDDMHPRSASEPAKRSYSPSMNNAAENQLVFDRVVAEKQLLNGPGDDLCLRRRSSSNQENKRPGVTFDDKEELRPKSLSFGNVGREGKTRSDSMNTDGTTSGFSSYDSDQPAHSLSSSLLDSSSIRAAPAFDRTLSHPSEINRRRANLKRMPTLHLPKSISMTRIAGSGDDDDAAILSPFGKKQDTFAYATLKTLQRQRTYSTDKESDLGLKTLYDEEPTLSMKRSLSIDFGVSRSVSFSFGEADSQQLSMKGSLKKTMSKVMKKMSAVAGTAEFVGLALPVDVGLIFHVTEDELRMQTTSDVIRFMDHRKLVGHVVWKDEQLDEDSDTGLEVHDMNNCLSCYRFKKATQAHTVLTVSEVDTDDADGYQNYSHSLSRQSNPETSDSGTPGSIQSIGSTLSGMLTAGKENNSSRGKAVIRKEILKFITNLSGTIGAEKSEKALLMRKQSHPKAFSDLCLYSEVCHFLGHYSFQLSARRFIQELFLDLKFVEFFDEPKLILGLQDNESEC